MWAYPLAVQGVADVVRAARGKRTQATFAKDAGVSMAVIYKLEKGQRVSADSLDKVVAHLGPERGAALRAAIGPDGIYRHSDPRPRTFTQPTASKDHHTTEIADLLGGMNVSRVPDRDLFEKLVGVWINMPHRERQRLVVTARRSLAATADGSATGKVAGRRPRP